MLCRRVESPRPQVDRHGDTAWYHPIGDGTAAAKARTLPGKERADALTAVELASMLKQFRADLSPSRLAMASRLLGVSASALLATEIGCRMGQLCWPMRDGRRQLCGFRVRRSSPRPGEPRYFSVKGSRNGLFVPSTFASIGMTPLLVVSPEGPTDLAAAVDAGFPHAVGRPSNSGGAEQLRTLLASHALRDVVIVAEHDLPVVHPGKPVQWPGWEGALRLAGAMLAGEQALRVRVARVIRLPGAAEMLAKGDRKVDLRDWVGRHGVAGASAAVEGVAERVTRQWLAERWAEVERRRSTFNGGKAA